MGKTDLTWEALFGIIKKRRNEDVNLGKGKGIQIQGNNGI